MLRPPIVLIHGQFLTRRCWDGWIARYEALGHRCIAPAYPEREAPVEELRGRHPDPATAAVGLPAVLDRFESAIRALGEPPILIGHSFGGLLTQLLLQRQLGACGVAIDSVPPAGVRSFAWSFVRSVWPLVNPLVSSSRPYLMTPAHFSYAVTHTLPPAAQQQAWCRHVVPESRRLARAALGRDARIDFAAPRPPLLLIAGAEDRIMPASLNRRNYARYRRSPAVTDFEVFARRDHWLIAAPGWEEIADRALDWALHHYETARTARAEQRTAS